MPNWSQVLRGMEQPPFSPVSIFSCFGCTKVAPNGIHLIGRSTRRGSDVTMHAKSGDRPGCPIVHVQETRSTWEEVFLFVESIKDKPNQIILAGDAVNLEWLGRLNHYQACNSAVLPFVYEGHEIRQWPRWIKAGEIPPKQIIFQLDQEIVKGLLRNDNLRDQAMKIVPQFQDYPLFDDQRWLARGWLAGSARTGQLLRFSFLSAFLEVRRTISPELVPHGSFRIFKRGFELGWAARNRHEEAAMVSP